MPLGLPVTTNDFLYESNIEKLLKLNLLIFLPSGVDITRPSLINSGCSQRYVPNNKIFEEIMVSKVEVS